MTGLLIVAHGSRREESNEEVQRLAERVRGTLGGTVAIVAHAFLETASPSVPEAIEAVALEGTKRLFVLPHFLAAGHHVDRDLPELVAASQRMYPAVTMQILPHLGAAPGLSDLLAGMISEAARCEGEG